MKTMRGIVLALMGIATSVVLAAAVPAVSADAAECSVRAAGVIERSGEAVTARFEVKGGDACRQTVMLAVKSESSGAQLGKTSGTFGPGKYSLTVKATECKFRAEVTSGGKVLSTFAGDGQACSSSTPIVSPAPGAILPETGAAAPVLVLGVSALAAGVQYLRGRRSV